MVTNLELFNNNGLELIVNTETGESFASVSGYARMSGKSQSTISARLSKFNVITSEVLTTGGVQAVRLITEDMMVEWLPKDNPEMATKMMKAGIRVFLHTLAGFNVSSTATQIKTPQTYLEALKALVAVEEEKEILRLQNEQLEKDNEHLATAVDELFSYSSILRIAKFNNCSEKNFNYYRLKAVSQQMGIEVKKVPCPRFGYKNLYAHDAWRVAYPNFKLPETLTLMTV